MRISTDHARHSTSTEVASRLAMGATFRADEAGAVAAWYQSPRGHGRIFAALASGLAVDSTELNAAILAELASAPAENRPELLALAQWAEVAAS